MKSDLRDKWESDILQRQFWGTTSGLVLLGLSLIMASDHK